MAGNRLDYDAVAALVAANNRSGQADAILIAIIYKESRFDPLARSSVANSSATGLMQMTRTAVTEVNRVKHALYRHGEMTIPATNIQVGSTYLKIRIERARGDLPRGLDGYGTGPGYSASIIRAANRLPGAPDPMAVLVAEIGR